MTYTSTAPALNPLRFFSRIRRWRFRLPPLGRRWTSGLFKILFTRAYEPGVTFLRIDEFAAEASSRWTRSELAEAKLTIVVVTYKQPIPLECLLLSLCCQTLQNFEVLVIHDGPDPETRRVVERFAERSPRYRFMESPTRYNDYGHSLRAMGIQAADREYLLITNGDNYYSPRFTEFVFEAIERHALDVTLWNLVHSHDRPGGLNLRSCSPFEVYPVRLMCDIGSIIVRTELAKKAGFVDRSHDADATYLEDVLALPVRPLRVGKIEKTLMVHN
jgi:glycosyltransferase involved in cell wall biosynthesis